MIPSRGSAKYIGRAQGPAYARFLCLVLLFGCQSRPATQYPEVPAGAMPAPEALADGKTIATPEDHSLNADEYLRLGVPAVDHAWTGGEIHTAAAVLKDVAKADASHLPRYRSERSGMLFARMTSAQNIDPYRDGKRFSRDERVNALLAVLDATSDLVLSSYVPGFDKQLTGDSELIELIGADLRVSLSLVSLVDSVSTAMTPQQRDAPARVAGLEKMRAGFAQMASGSLTMLTETSSYRTSERLRLLGYLRVTLPFFVTHLSPAAQAALLSQLDAVVHNPQLTPLQPALDSLAGGVRRAVKP
jgi:hypothetical protein